MVGERGFEPPTPWSRTRCSTRLSHSPTFGGRVGSRVMKVYAVPDLTATSLCTRIGSQTHTHCNAQSELELRSLRQEAGSSTS